jgi:sugar/nucleoside kinase (ribokinase family)
VTLSSDVPDFLAIGHVTFDHTETGKMRLGGAALYASLTARRLGKRAAILTSHGKDFPGEEVLDGIATSVIRAGRTSTFRNVYGSKGRVQHVYAAAASLDPRELPATWRKAGIVYLCPVLHEVPMNIGGQFPESLIGIAPQGWMRTWDESGKIRSRRWEGFEGLLRCSRMVIVSEEDIVGEGDLVRDFCKYAPLVIVTRAERGATIFTQGTALTLGAYRAEERDPTGAGDCFGAAFLVRYAETGDIEEAGRFASCVGASVVETEGIAGIPTREDVTIRMGRESVSCRWTTN